MCDRGIGQISASRIVHRGPAAAVARIPEADSYYVTIDIDVLDPAIAPATGTPVPGGLSYYQMSDVLEGIAAKGKLAGRLPSSTAGSARVRPGARASSEPARPRQGRTRPVFSRGSNIAP